MRTSPLCLPVLVLVISSCGAPRNGQPASPAPTSQSASRASKPAELHNLIRVTEKLYSGSVPEGDAAFDELRTMGVVTIISVDGAAPDVYRARSRGMRYVHLPIGYHGIDPDRRLEITRAVRDLPGPIYLHCHHGKHRGPAAAATAAIVLGDLASSEGLMLLKKAGTSEGYTGLYACVIEAEPVSPDRLDTVITDFPEIARTPDFVKAMVAAQDAYDHLVEIRDAGWAVPSAHPDLVPIAEAGQLENLLRALKDDPESLKYPGEFSRLMSDSHEATIKFESALESMVEKAQLTERLRVVGDSCKTCHVQYRDTR